MIWNAQSAQALNASIEGICGPPQKSFAEIVATDSHARDSISRLLSGDPNQYLDTAFVWSDTELGHGFWRAEMEDRESDGLSPAAVLYLHDVMRKAQKIMLDKLEEF